jgi:RNase P subunit RPR2
MGEPSARREYWTDESSEDIAECKSLFVPSELKLRVCAECGRGIVCGYWRVWREVASLVDQKVLVELGPLLDGRPYCRECWELSVSGVKTY